MSPDHREPLSVRNSATDAEGGERRGRDSERKHYNHHNNWGYKIPDDPWIINARFRKDGMFPPGVAHPSSTQSSRVDLTTAHEQRRRSSTQTSGSMQHSTSDVGETGSGSGTSSEAGRFESGHWQGADEAVFVYMTIQLYSIDRDFFVVDFKCAGYERLVDRIVCTVRREGNEEREKGERNGNGNGNAGSGSGSEGTSVSNLALEASLRDGKMTGGSGSGVGVGPGAGAHHGDGWDDARGVWRRLGDGEALAGDLAKDIRDRASGGGGHGGGDGHGNGNGNGEGAHGEGSERAHGHVGVPQERYEEVGAGRVKGDKRATSPFPFLDVASTLILQLSGE